MRFFEHAGTFVGGHRVFFDDVEDLANFGMGVLGLIDLLIQAVIDGAQPLFG